MTQANSGHATCPAASSAQRSASVDVFAIRASRPFRYAPASASSAGLRRDAHAVRAAPKNDPKSRAAVPSRSPFLTSSPKSDHRLPDGVARARDIVFQVGRVHQARRRRTPGIDLDEFARQHAVMPENVLECPRRRAARPAGLRDSPYPNSPPMVILPSASASSVSRPEAMLLE